MEGKSNRPTRVWPVYVALLVFGVVVIVFIIEFISASERSPDTSSENLTAETYIETVTRLLEGADPANGDKLIDQYECGVCHRKAANRIAPSFVGIAERAASRRPPLTAAAYLYESIFKPDAYVVEGYASAMLKNYPERLTERELGDIIAYLLTPDAQ